MTNVVTTRQEELKADVAKMAQDYDLFDFIQGQADCRDGVPHESGKGESYDAGYGAQYRLDQMIEAMGRAGQ